MARNNTAVAAAQSAFFDRDWSRISGSVPRARQKQMVRAAMGHSPAIFKAIRDGGTHTRAQLRNQLGYLTSNAFSRARAAILTISPPSMRTATTRMRISC